jgi:hypothetical protein
MRRTLGASLLACCLLLMDAVAQPVISEFMADNQTTAPDDFGDFSDWIEIHNPTSAAIDLGQWVLTDNAANLSKWRFPQVVLEPGGFMMVWASGRNLRNPAAPLHTNFSLARGGEYLALVRPDGETVEQDFAPAFPPLRADESFGLRFNRTVHVAEGAAVRYRVPSSADSPPADWRLPAFNDSAWTQGPSGLGFGLMVPGMTVRHVFKNGGIQGLTDAANLSLLPDGDPLVLRSTTVVLPVLNILGTGGDGRYGSNYSPPGGNGDNYVIRATGFIEIPAAGTYTFGLNSDDGGRIRINGINVMVDDTFHGPQDNFGNIQLAAGQHSFEVIMFEGGGGDCVEFFAAAGVHTVFNASAFRLVGDVANGGLPVMTVPDGGGNVIATNIQSPMAGRAGAYFRVPVSQMPAAGSALSLVMRYNDGFAAYLGGTQVASSNSPASPLWNSVATAERGNPESMRRTGFNVTPGLAALSGGNSVLALHGMRSSTSDPTFLMLPELVSGTVDASSLPVLFSGENVTPGWVNGPPSSLGPVAALNFSVIRGIYSAPFQLQISSATPGATIRYTTNGSTPSPTRGTVYTGPLSISSTTVLRAMAYKEDYDPTPVSTHTYLFPDDVIVQSPTGQPPPGWPATSGTSQVLNYGMDPNIVNHADPRVGGRDQVKAALLALPTVSVTTDLPNLFNMDGSRGIYSNPYDRGYSAERRASFEWINPPTAEHPAGTSEFQLEAGLRIRGGFSRSPDNPKHSLRFLFRGEYGAGKLRYPLFGEEGADVFDKIDFRTAQNYSWAFGGDDRNTFLREESTRQAHLDMGQPGSRVRYFHLYLNGQYWGLFNLDERTEADYAATYLGGAKEDYDVVRADQTQGYTTVSADGNLNAWRELWDKAKVHRANPSNENYFRMMGLAADGVTPTVDPVLLDPDNLIDYMLLTFWTGNFDGATSSFLGNDRANNWSGARRRDGNTGQGFQFFVHDFEHSMFNVNEDRTGPFPSANESNFAYANPMFFHQDLMANTEYRMRWADRVYQHMFRDGPLTAQAWQQRVERFAAIIDQAIIAESARWGDSKTSVAKTRLTWLNARQQLLNYLPLRGPVVLNQLRNDGLYPSIDAPTLMPVGGSQALGTEVVATAPPGSTLYYMLDGSDPRAVGGALRAGAQVYTPSVETTVLIPWSASGWAYLHNGTDQGTAWREPGFNDSSWPRGAAELGYGDGDEATVIFSGTGPKPATAYFRKTFDVADPSRIQELSLRVKYDDAYIVYINGQRVAGNLPVDPPFNFYSGTAIEDTIVNVQLSPQWLRAGQNTLAIEVHQANSSSSDLSMNLFLHATVQAAASSIVLDQYGRRSVRMRARSGSTWSALADAHYEVGLSQPDPGRLVVSEISYHPPSPHGQAEFIELLNLGSGLAIDLSGARFTHGVDFTFPEGSLLLPGERILVIRNRAAFEALYGPDLPIAGEFENDTALSNTGERLRLEARDGTTLFDLTYGSGLPWPTAAGGEGHTMVLTDPSRPDDPAAWRPSATAYGNPNGSDYLPLAQGQALLEYALRDAAGLVDPQTGQFSVLRTLGADDVSLAPEWSGDLSQWSAHSLTRVSEVPDGAGGSLITWRLDPAPPGPVFFRLRVTQKP